MTEGNMEALKVVAGAINRFMSGDKIDTEQDEKELRSDVEEAYTLLTEEDVESLSKEETLALTELGLIKKNEPKPENGKEDEMSTKKRINSNGKKKAIAKKSNGKKKVAAKPKAKAVNKNNGKKKAKVKAKTKSNGQSARGKGIGAWIKEQLKKNPSIEHAKLAKQAREKFQSKTSPSCISWYKARM